MDIDYILQNLEDAEDAINRNKEILSEYGIEDDEDAEDDEDENIENA